MVLNVLIKKMKTPIDATPAVKGLKVYVHAIFRFWCFTYIIYNFIFIDHNLKIMIKMLPVNKECLK